MVRYRSHKAAFLKFAIASFIFVGGAFCFLDASAKDKASVSIITKDGFRYVESLGIPRHGGSKAVKPRPYGFRVVAKPELKGNITHLKPGQFFGVALDGVPFSLGIKGFWNDDDGWPEHLSKMDAFGGFIQSGGQYLYGSIPSGLLTKDLSHIGYAADGFPIFVSKKHSFQSSYRLKEGRRPEGVAPDGVYNGRYVTDYQYIPRSGNLDECNGVTVNKKYYIYVLTNEFPFVPRCWSGVPDGSFLNFAAPVVSENKAGVPSGLKPDLTHRQESLIRRGRSY